MPLDFIAPQSEEEHHQIDVARAESDQRQAATSNDSMADGLAADHTEESAQLSAELAALARRRSRTVLAGFSAMFASVLGSVLFFGRVDSLSELYKHPNFALFLACLAFLLPMLTIVAMASLIIRGHTKSMRRKVQRLRANRSAGATSVLIDLLSHNELRTRNSAALGLLEILPRWTEDDLGALGTQQRLALHAALLTPRAHQVSSTEEAALPAAVTELRIQLCRTFARVGGHSELQALRRAAAESASDSGRSDFQEMARACATSLEARLAGQVLPRTLLRASEARHATAAELLRAASASASSPDDLLRASSPRVIGPINHQ